MKGEPAIRAPSPAGDRGISRAERREVQRLLLACGHDIGEADGFVGANPLIAVSDFRTQTGVAADGRVGQWLSDRQRKN